MPPLEERTEYPYQNIRVKNFPWGDGDKVRTRTCTFINVILGADVVIFFTDHLVSSLRPNRPVSRTTR